MIGYRTYVLAGRAVFTAVSNETGDRYTFRVSRSQDGRAYFVAFLSGSNNMSDYTYIGLLNTETGIITLTKKSRENGLTDDTKVVKSARVVIGRLVRDDAARGFEFVPSTNCCVCGAPLTTPESVAAGVGPKCAGRL